MSFFEKIQLKGTLASLSTLEEADIPGLLSAGSSEEIWEHLPINGTKASQLAAELKGAIALRNMQLQHPFTIRDTATQRIIGSTRLFEYFPEHKKMEIGWTWLHPDYWCTGHNISAKFLLLQHAFQKLALNRVQLKTRDINVQSRRAIEKLGASFEGILRNDRVLKDGSIRNTAMYSITKEDWPSVSENLQSRLQKHTASK